MKKILIIDDDTELSFVEISAKENENRAEIIFRDFGNGIPEEEILFIFDKILSWQPYRQ